VESQIRTHGDDRPARIIDPLAEEILTETSLFALEHVGKGPEGTLVGTGNGPAPASVVEQHIHGFLEHALFVADDYLRGVELHKAFEPVVTVDYPPVEVIEVGGGETAPVQRHQRTKVRGNDGEHGEDHPLRFVAGFLQGLHHLEALDQFFLFCIRNGGFQFLPEFTVHLVQVQLFEEFAYGFRADAHLEGVLTVLLP